VGEGGGKNFGGREREGREKKMINGRNGKLRALLKFFFFFFLKKRLVNPSWVNQPKMRMECGSFPPT
jgi:hypothetical protein